MAESAKALAATRERADFFLGNGIPTCVADDVREGAAVMRRVRAAILVPSSTRGGQMRAFEERLAVFAD